MLEKSLPGRRSARSRLGDAAPAGEYVWGAAAVGRLLSKSTRSTYHLLETGKIPAKKVGAQWVVSRQELRSFLRGGGAA